MFHGFGNCEDLVMVPVKKLCPRQSMFLVCLVFLIWAELICETGVVPSS